MMKPIPKRFGGLVSVLFALSVVGCSHSDEVTAVSPQNKKPLEERVQDIQNNPNMPLAQKQALIAAQQRQVGTQQVMQKTH